MTEWRLFRGWTSEELRDRLDRLKAVPRNFEGEEEDLTPDRGWHHYQSEAVIAREPANPARLKTRPTAESTATEDVGWVLRPADQFERAKVALAKYEFSDPRIVAPHFDPKGPLLGRRFLLEVKVFGLRYLCAAVVTRVRDEPGVYGFRYDTLESHIERGLEWFLLTKGDDGSIRFRIEARWKPARMPNWWSRIGFSLVSGHFQRTWHRRAHERLSAGENTDVVFTYYTKRKLFQ